MKKYYVYLEGICGVELIATADILKEAEKYKADKLAKWKPGYMWTVTIKDKEQEEVNYWD